MLVYASAIESSSVSAKAVGEPPFFLGTAAFFAVPRRRPRRRPRWLQAEIRNFTRDIRYYMKSNIYSYNLYFGDETSSHRKGKPKKRKRRIFWDGRVTYKDLRLLYFHWLSPTQHPVPGRLAAKGWSWPQWPQWPPKKAFIAQTYKLVGWFWCDISKVKNHHHMKNHPDRWYNFQELDGLRKDDALIRMDNGQVNLGLCLDSVVRLLLLDLGASWLFPLIFDLGEWYSIHSLQVLG